jgi:hypothetical protein
MTKTIEELKAEIEKLENTTDRSGLGPYIDSLYTELKEKTLPCHVCGTLITVEELDENGAYTYPDNKPYCEAHQPEDNE